MELIKFFQLLAILQGLYFILVFFQKKSKNPSYYLFLGSIVSLLLYLIGDDTNLWLGYNWFLLDIYLFITFFFLFIKYFLGEQRTFNTKDYLFFTPNALVLFVELTDLILERELLAIILLENILNWVFIAYVIWSIYYIKSNKDKRQTWQFPFAVSLITILLFSHFDEQLIEAFPDNNTVAFFASGYFTSLAVSTVFFYISFKLHLQPSKFFKNIFDPQYKSSSLNKAVSKRLKKELLHLMASKKPFKNPKLTLSDLARQVQTSKQNISQIINLEFKTNFNDFVNKYRVEEFKLYLENNTFCQFTLLGIAKEAGFNSKSSFHTIFKHFEGITPSEYRNLLQNKLQGGSELSSCT